MYFEVFNKNNIFLCNYHLYKNLSKPFHLTPVLKENSTFLFHYNNKKIKIIAHSKRKVFKAVTRCRIKVSNIYQRRLLIRGNTLQAHKWPYLWYSIFPNGLCCTEWQLRNLNLPNISSPDVDGIRTCSGLLNLYDSLFDLFTGKDVRHLGELTCCIRQANLSF